MDKREKEKIRAKEYYYKNRDKVLKKQSERYYRVVKNSPRRIFNCYKYGAKDRNYSFEIEFDDFMELWNKDCAYCGCKIKTIGIDRVDNTIGYTKKNILPCCRRCNMMKSDMSLDGFYKRVLNIYKAMQKIN